MKIGVPKETFPGERRVALTPDLAFSLGKAGFAVTVENGAGESAGFPDEQYRAKGIALASRGEVFSSADAILQVRTLGANPDAGQADLPLFRKGHILIGMGEPLTAHKENRELASMGVTYFALELIPRITRAQSMDVLSSMATVAGYKAVIMAAGVLPRMFPLLMTAAGTVTPARVFIIGAGVAGLQAIATARRLGAIVKGYDVRPAVKEQVESLGAKFVELELETGKSEDKGGYAKAMDEEFYRRQRILMGKILTESDVVITTAAIPGAKAPILITAEMVKGMPPGSVVVDLAAERGGNCELTRPGEDTVVNGILILGPLNLPATIPYHASQMYGKNMSNFLNHLAPKATLNLNMDDEILRETRVSSEGEIQQTKVRERMNLPSLTQAAKE